MDIFIYIQQGKDDLTWLSSAYIGMSWNGEMYFPSAFSEGQWRRRAYGYISQTQADFTCLMSTECPNEDKPHEHNQWIVKKGYRLPILLTFTSGWDYSTFSMMGTTEMYFLNFHLNALLTWTGIKWCNHTTLLHFLVQLARMVQTLLTPVIPLQLKFTINIYPPQWIQCSFHTAGWRENTFGTLWVMLLFFFCIWAVFLGGLVVVFHT